MQSVVPHTESALAPVAAAVSARDRVRRSGEGDTAVYALGGVLLVVAAARITAVGGQRQRVFLTDGEMVRDAGALSGRAVVVAMEGLSTR